jgi:DNA-binding PadR family transcriptional regulator
MHGYQIIQEITERSDAGWVPSPGSVYPTISQLADEGLVRTEKTDGRTVAQLTEHGQAYTAEHRDELDAVWNTTAAAGDDEASALRATGQGLVAAAAQVARTGTPAQLTEATRLLAETRRRLYLLLAGEDPGDRTDTEG